MTIKELEQRTGMPRANIRYYEEEGLLSPRRLDNGYRDYAEEDVRTLEKIKLLCSSSWTSAPSGCSSRESSP